MALIDKLAAIANAIRGVTGGTAPLTLEDMVAEIGAISGNGDDSAIPFGEYFNITLPTKEKLIGLGYAVHEFTLVSTPSSIWTLPNPLGRMPEEIVALFRIDTGVADLIGSEYPVYAVNTEFVNGSYTNQNTFSLDDVSYPDYAKHKTFSAGSYRWLAALPDSEKITLRSPADSVWVRWQPGEYILAVK